MTNSEGPRKPDEHELSRFLAKQKARKVDMDPEYARLTAQELANKMIKMDDVIEKLYSRNRDKVEKFDEYNILKLPPLTIEHRGTSWYGLFYPYNTISGIGAGTIHYQFERGDLEQPWSVFTRAAGHPIYRILKVALHTDEQTMEKAAEHLEKHPKDRAFFWTDYLFEENGNFTKISYFPQSFDDRPDIQDYHGNFKFVISPMTPQDFELAGFALNELQRGLDQLIQ